VEQEEGATSHERRVETVGVELDKELQQTLFSSSILMYVGQNHKQKAKTYLKKD
jgi:hypothetical protein